MPGLRMVSWFCRGWLPWLWGGEYLTEDAEKTPGINWGSSRSVVVHAVVLRVSFIFEDWVFVSSLPEQVVTSNRNLGLVWRFNPELIKNWIGILNKSRFQRHWIRMMIIKPRSVLQDNDLPEGWMVLDSIMGNFEYVLAWLKNLLFKVFCAVCLVMSTVGAARTKCVNSSSFLLFSRAVFVTLIKFFLGHLAWSFSSEL